MRQLLIVLFVAVCACGSQPKFDKPPRPPLSEAEAVELSRSAGVMCQPAIGFSLKDPGQRFTLRPELSNAAGNVRVWGYQSDETGERVLVTIVKAMGEMPDGFGQFFAGVRQSVTEGGSLEEESLDTQSLPYVGSLAAKFPNGNSYAARCIGTGDTGAMPWSICVATVSYDHEALRELRESLGIRQCGAP